jgi:hypothetical protein
MERLAGDELKHKLAEVEQIYGRKIPPEAVEVWCKVLRDASMIEIRRAFDFYFREGKYAPRPADIFGMIASSRPARSTRDDSDAPGVMTRATGRAWLQFIHAVYFGAPKQPEGGQEWGAVLLLVNREAARQGRPDAIPAPYRLPDCWGED